MSESKQTEKNKTRFGWMDLIPFLLFVLAVAFFFGAIHATYSTQGRDAGIVQEDVPNITVDRVVFEDLDDPEQDIVLGRGEMDGPAVVNFFASWCLPCKEEHPLLMRLSQRTDVPLIGVAFSDDKQATRKFLTDLGNPYDRVGMDAKAEVGVKFAVDGIPATFLLDSSGTIVWRYKGPLREIASLVDAIEKLDIQ